MPEAESKRGKGYWKAGFAVAFSVFILWANNLLITATISTGWGVWELIKTRGTKAGLVRGPPLDRTSGWMLLSVGLTIIFCQGATYLAILMESVHRQ